MNALAMARTATSRDWMQHTDVVASAIGAAAVGHDRDDSFVMDNYALLKREGYFKAHVPTELGGHGVGFRPMCEIIRRLGAACGSTALAFSMHTHLVAVAAWRWRNQNAPTDTLLRRVSGEDLVLVSSGGSDWLKGAGAATRTNGGYLINARKIFSSGCPAGDLLMTSAVLDDPEAGPTVLHFGVSLKSPGVAILDTWRAMGMRGTGSHDIELKDVFVPEAAISGRRPQGKWHPLFHAISMLAFPLIYSAYLGVAEGARAKALEMARKRALDEATAHSVGEMENAFAAATMGWRDMIENAEIGAPGPEVTNRAMIGRTLVAQASIKTVERAIEAAGGASFYREAGLERAFRDVQAARFHPLQEKQQLRYAGRFMLGLDIDG